MPVPWRWRSLVLPAVALLVAAFAVISYAGPSYYRRFQAERALARHDPVAARSIVSKLSKTDSDDPSALLLAARAARGLGEYAEAERRLAAAETAGGPRDAIGFEGLLLGLCQGDFAGEELGVKQLADRNDAHAAEAMLALAKGYFVAFRHAETTQICDRLIGQDPNPVAALILRGDVSDVSRKHGDAEKDYRKAVDAAPRNALARSALARFLTKAGSTREALAHYALARQFGANDALTRLGHARALSDDGQTNRAESVLNEQRGDHPENADARSNWPDSPWNGTTPARPFRISSEP